MAGGNHALELSLPPFLSTVLRAILLSSACRYDVPSSYISVETCKLGERCNVKNLEQRIWTLFQWHTFTVLANFAGYWKPNWTTETESCVQ